MSNRFCLTECDCIGWDLDHTLIRYQLENFDQLIFKSFQRYLVEIANFTPEIYKVPKLEGQYYFNTFQFSHDPEFARKGIVL